MRLCSIASGSSGNCIYTGSEKTHLLIDAGISAKKIEEGLQKLQVSGKDLQGVLITHEHADHVKGVGILARRYGLPLYATAGTIAKMEQMKSLGKVDKELYQVIRADQKFRIGDVEVTDLGVYNNYIVESLKKLDVLLLEANHDVQMLEVGPYPYPLKQRILGECGHLSNESAGQLLCKVLHDGLRKIYLGHLSKENNYAKLAYETVRLEIDLGDVKYKAEDFDIQVANRDCCTEICEW